VFIFFITPAPHFSRGTLTYVTLAQREKAKRDPARCDA